jgi:ectoine hydroxylase-related dioxygenase (phytanoyl-CoA dioxygenase family)
MDWVVPISTSESISGVLAATTESAALAAFHEHGCVLLRGFFRPTAIEAMHQAYISRFGALDDGCMRDAAARPKPNRFLEVGDSRYEIVVGMDGALGALDIFANAPLQRFLRPLLGQELQLSAFTVVVSHPGAIQQHDHRDYASIGPDIPAYAINAAVPLLDVDLQTGPTGFWLGSHRWPNDRRPQPADTMTVCPLQRGDCLLMDYRTIHAGMPNLSKQVRPILYMAYARPWFFDQVNHIGRNPLDMPLKTYRALPASVHPLLTRAFFYAMVARWGDVDIDDSAPAAQRPPGVPSSGATVERNSGHSGRLTSPNGSAASMSAVEAATLVSGLAEIRREGFWLEHFPGLSIGTRLASGDLQQIEPQASVMQGWSERMREEGYLRGSSDTLKRLAPRLAEAVETFRALNIPSVFIFLFDEAWECFYALHPMLRLILGEPYYMLPDFWAWHVDPQRAEAGWGPHRERGRVTLKGNGEPVSLSVWIPLTESVPDNGCIYLVPANRDPVYGTEKENNWKSENFELQSVRALPAAPGDFLCWNQAVIHWGGGSSRFASDPRMSMSLEFQSGKIAPFNEPLLPSLNNPSFAARLALVGQQILQYRHRYPLAPGLELLAKHLVGETPLDAK